MTTEQINAASTQEPAAPAQKPTTDGENSGQSNGAKFTQEQVNEMVGKTRKDARETAIADMLKELGLTSKDDIKTLKATIEDTRKRKEAEMTEAQKAQALLQQVSEEKSQLEALLNAERMERRHDKIASALSSAASKLQAKDTDDVLTQARDKHADELNAVMDDAGNVSKEKLDALLEKIKAAKPHYFGAITGTVTGTVIPSNANGRSLPPHSKELETASKNLRRDIKRF